ILSNRRMMLESKANMMESMVYFSFNVLDTFNSNQQLDMLRDLAPRYGLDPDTVVQMLLAQEDFAQFNSEVFMHTVIPNLARLGLITERTEAKYRAAGIMWGDRFGAGTDADVAASLRGN